MKTKKIICAIISVVLLLSCLTVSAATFPPADSDVWTNLTDKEATNLLKSKSESFIFFFYRDICPNSQSSISAILKYANKNNMSLCGLNTTDYPAWMTWSDYLEPGQTSIGFPFIIIYNADKDVLVAKDNVLTVKEFEKLIAQASIQPGSTGVPSKPSQPLFTDVPENHKNYAAIKQLAGDGILTGYEDGSFGPDNTITRAEAAVVIVRAGGLTTNSSIKSTYTDVANSYWGKDYIMAASQAGIIKGMGDNIFDPTNKVTNNQIIKMIVCMLDMEDTALKNGGWPLGYVEVALNTNIIDSDTYIKINTGDLGNQPATRGQVAQWIYNSRRAKGGSNFKIAGKTYKLGMSASELGTADEIWPSVNGFSWHIFGTDNYENFFAAGVIDGKVVSLASTGVAFEYKGYRAGETLTDPSENNGDFLLDKNDGNIIHGVFLIDDNYRAARLNNTAALQGESKMNFHCVNGFRTYHKMEPYEWDNACSESARLHSVDMATNDYFSHTAINGTSAGERMRAQGVNWTSCGENIAAGSGLGIGAYDNWVNSSGHRKNILGTYTHLGVGFAYDASSSYKFYSTQNFYARSSAFDTFFN